MNNDDANDIIPEINVEDDDSSSSSSSASEEVPSEENENKYRNRSNSHASSSTMSSFPSIHTLFLSGDSSRGEGETQQKTTDETQQETAVSVDQERQILVLMLLAQVSALHDATPKTFTVHVLELFERGILDRESIHFLFELGLVPSLSPSRGLLTNGPASDEGNAESQLALVAANPIHTAEQLRIKEASSIRSRLTQEEKQEPNAQSSNEFSKPWKVENFPLFLSRYQREFQEAMLLNRGSFGEVYHCTNNMDGCNYAIKKVTFDVTGFSTAKIQEVVREVQCLSAVNNHPNVVRYYSSWLEPSWVTGSGQSIENTMPQHKLLTDIQQLMQPSDHSRRVNSENGSSYFTRDSASGYRRRFSFGSSVDSFDQSWGNYQDARLSELGRAYDDSYIIGGRQAPPPQGGKPTTSSSTNYHYQISLFIQMQLCHTATLADWIRERNRQIPENDHLHRIGPALEIFQQIVSGLSHVHSRKIIHRDLKPANIFASEDGKVILIGDFGLSKQILDLRRETSTSASSSATNSPSEFSSKMGQSAKFSHHEHWHNAKSNSEALVPIRKTDQSIVQYRANVAHPHTVGIGTASYASPEQVKSRNYGVTADMFSLGLILLELVSCFETEHERLHNFQECRNQRLARWIQENYPEIGSMILACTRDDPDQRPSAKSLLEEVSRILSPTPYKEAHILQRQLAEKEEQLKEKDKIIENLRLEMKKMKAHLLITNGSSDQALRKLEPESECVTVEECTSFQNDES